MYRFLNNTLQRVGPLTERGDLSTATVALAVLVGVIIELFVAKLILAGFARLLSLKK